MEPLNEVVGLLAGWQQPTLMLPGNHDQASRLAGWLDGSWGSDGLPLPAQAVLLLGCRVVLHAEGAQLLHPLPPSPHCCPQASLGGEVHALTPLAAANPLIHAFDGPTMFLNALWMPYRRNRAMLEAALAAATAEAAAAAAASGSGRGGGARLQAVFAHTDIVSGCLGLGSAASRHLKFRQLQPSCHSHYQTTHPNRIPLSPLFVCESADGGDDERGLPGTRRPAP